MSPLLQFECILIEWFRCRHSIFSTSRIIQPQCILIEWFYYSIWIRSNWMSPNVRIKVRVGYSTDAPIQSDSDDSSEDGMLASASRDSLSEKAGDDVQVTPFLRDSIICPRYDPCVLRYGKSPALSSWCNYVFLSITFNLLPFNIN